MHGALTGSQNLGFKLGLKGGFSSLKSKFLRQTSGYQKLEDALKPSGFM